MICHPMNWKVFPRFVLRFISHLTSQGSLKKLSEYSDSATEWESQLTMEIKTHGWKCKRNFWHLINHSAIDCPQHTSFTCFGWLPLFGTALHNVMVNSFFETRIPLPQTKLMSFCKTAPKSLFCMPSYVCRIWVNVPCLAYLRSLLSVCQSGWKEIRNEHLVISLGPLGTHNKKRYWCCFILLL